MQIAPDGATIFGETEKGLAFADVSTPDALRPLMLPPTADTETLSLNWSPDGSRFVLTDASRRQFLVRVSDGHVTELDLQPGATWLNNGMQLGIEEATFDNPGSLKVTVLDRDGALLWTKTIVNAWGGGAWSADGAFLYYNYVEERPATREFGALTRVDVIDVGTGLTAFRLRGMFCQQGWVADTHQIIMYSWAPFGQVLVDLESRTVRELTVPQGTLFPTPFDRQRAILYDGTTLSWYDLATGATTQIARKDGSVQWETRTTSGFAGDHLVLFAPVQGHGGCLEASDPADPPEPAVVAGPFADDVPVTRGTAP